MSYIPDPYDAPYAGISITDDKNGPTPDGASQTGDPVSQPEFLEHCKRRLVEVRNRLSAIFAEEYGSRNLPPLGTTEKTTVGELERKQLLEKERKLLRQEESYLEYKIREFESVASLGDPAVASEDQYMNEAMDGAA